MIERRVRQMVGHPNLILETLPDVAKEQGLQCKSNPPNFHNFNEWNGATVLLNGPKVEAKFMVQQMPGCCAILTASYIDVWPNDRDTFNKVVHIISDAAYEAGFGSLVLTQVVFKDDITKHLWGQLPNRGFLMSEPFINAKSGNRVVYLTKNLGQKAKRAGLEIPLAG